LAYWGTSAEVPRRISAQVPLEATPGPPVVSAVLSCSSAIHFRHPVCCSLQLVEYAAVFMYHRMMVKAEIVTAIMTNVGLKILNTTWLWAIINSLLGLYVRKRPDRRQFLSPDSVACRWLKSGSSSLVISRMSRTYLQSSPRFHVDEHAYGANLYHI
jgi:hypothetical protein